MQVTSNDEVLKECESLARWREVAPGACKNSKHIACIRSVPIFNSSAEFLKTRIKKILLKNSEFRQRKCKMNYFKKQTD